MPTLLLCATWLQMMPTWCHELLQACTAALSEWSAAVEQQQRQQQQLKASTQPPAQLPQGVDELYETSIWPPLAAGSLLRCMQKQDWHKQVDERQLLATLGQLVQKVTQAALVDLGGLT